MTENQGIPKASREAFAAVVTRARKDGRDLIDVLDAEGLLLTSRRRREIEKDALYRLAAMMAESSPHQWLERGSPATATDMFRCIMLKVNVMAQDLERG